MPSGSSIFSDSPHLAFALQKLSKPTLPLSQTLALPRALSRPCLRSCPATPHSQPQLSPSLSPLPHSCLPLTWVSFFICHFSALPPRTAPTLSLCICLSLLPKTENPFFKPHFSSGHRLSPSFPRRQLNTAVASHTWLQTPSACAHCRFWPRQVSSCPAGPHPFPQTLSTSSKPFLVLFVLGVCLFVFESGFL